MPTNCLEIRTEKVLIKAKSSLHRQTFSPSRYFVLQRAMFLLYLCLALFMTMMIIHNLEYNYDNVIMWKSCFLILTIPLTWMTSVLWKYWLSQSVLQHLCGDTKIPWLLRLRYISKVSSPDGFSIHGLWSVTKFKFTKLQEWYGSSLVLRSMLGLLYIYLKLFKKIIHHWSKDNQWSMKIFDSEERRVSCWLREKIRCYLWYSLMFNFLPFVNKSHVLREEVFNEIFWGKLIYLEIFSEQTTNIISSFRDKGKTYLFVQIDFLHTPSWGVGWNVKAQVWKIPNFYPISP